MYSPSDTCISTIRKKLIYKCNREADFIYIPQCPKEFSTTKNETNTKT